MEDIYEQSKCWLEKRCHKTFNNKHSDFLVLVKFLKRHPSYSKWKYEEPVSFKITRNVQKSLVVFVKFKGTNKYRIVSWVTCARGKLNNKSEANKLTQAMRHAIRKQLKNFRNRHPYKECVLCKSGQNIEVDHHPIHFSTLKQQFIDMKLKKNEEPPTEFGYIPKKGRFIFRKGTKKDNYYDNRWKKAWQRYHNKHATYKYLCSTCNKKTNQQK